MSLSNNFPAIAPSLLLDFANVKALDPRITFTRTTTATYYDGVTTAKAEQNLFLYSQEFDNGTGWIAQNATVSANSTTAPDGTSTADSLIEDNTASAVHRISDAISGNVPVTGSTEYVFSVFAKANTRDWIALSPSNPGVNNYLTYFDLTNGVVGTSAGGNTGSIESVGNGWYRCIVKRTTASNQTQIDAQIYLATGDGTSSYTGDNTSGLYLWGAQIEQRSAVSSYTPTTTQPITNYIPVLQTAASGVARFDHNPTTGESLGLLVEEQRTNLLLRSEEFGTTWITDQLSVSENVIVAPDGTLTGDKLVENTATASRSIRQSVTGLASGATVTFSVYLKAAERSISNLYINDNSTTGNRVQATINLLTGVVSNVLNIGTFTGATASAVSVGNGWYRCVLTGAATGVTAVQGRAFISNTTYTGDGYSGVYLWGAQLEAGAFPTSYIPTVAATVTRNADVASMTGTNFSSWFNNAEGTVYSEIGNTVNINQRGYAISDNTINNVISNIVTTSSGSGAYFEVRAIGSVFAGVPTSITPVSNQYYKLAGAYAFNDVAASRDGGTVGTDGSAVMPLNVDRLYLGSNQSGTGGFINGTIKKIAYYPARLTNAQLQALTS